MDSWASLPTDLLLVIFLSLENYEVICCAGVCKTWRRAIIGNASILGPHLDCFGPSSLLLGIFHHCKDAACLRRTPGPFQSVLPWNDDGDDNKTAAAHSLIPASSAASSGVDRGSYKELLCSRDGFILLIARSGRDRSLCLCNPMTGDCTFLPSAARGRYSTYFLLTSYNDLSPYGTGNNMVARVLAVHTITRYNDFESAFKFKTQVLSYQIFSTSGDNNAGKWGPVKRSIGELEEGLCVWMDRWSTVVCGGAVYWLAGPGGHITSVWALDVSIGQTWTMELPTQCQFPINVPILAILVTSGDGRPCLMQAFDGHPEIQVWVLTRDSGWTQHQTVSVARECQISGRPIPRWFYFCAFCPRSWCLVGMSLESGHEFLIDLGTGSLFAPFMCIGKCDGVDCCPYEIDCSSTYISRMKNF